MNHLLLILFGGPVAIGVPVLVARALVESHADASAAAIRRHSGTDVDEVPAPQRCPSLTSRPALPARTTEVAR